MKRWLIGLSFALLAPLAWALPSVADVQAQVQKGHYAEAESMMREVVAAKPGTRARATCTPRSWRTTIGSRRRPRRRRGPARSTRR